MLKAIFSFISLAAIMVTTANFLVERGFTPEKLSSKKLSLSSFEQSSNSIDRANFPIKVVKERPANHNQKIDIKPIEPALELTEADFVPRDPDVINKVNNGAEESIAFIRLEKVMPQKRPILAVKEVKRVEEARRTIKTKITKINGSEPIRLYGFKKGPSIKTTSLAASFRPIEIEKRIEEKRNALIAQNTNNKKDHDKPAETTVDRISTGLAATEKSVDLKASKDIVFNKFKPKESSASNEELVFFDYSKTESLKDNGPKTNLPKKLPKGAMESRPSKVNVPALAKTAPKVKANSRPDDKVLGDILKHMGDTYKKDKQDKVVVSQAKSGPKMSGQNKSGFVDKNAFLEKNMNTQNYRSSYNLSVQSRSIGNSKREKVQDFDVRFADDINDIRQSDSDGTITFSEILNSPYAVRRGTVMARNHYPMTIDFTFEGQTVHSTLPLITEASFNRLLEAQGLAGLGGQILVQLDELTEDVELSAEAVYEKKIFLDRGLKVVERTESDFHYIMFVGVEPGNKIISFKTYKRDVASKIIHVAQDEIYFDFNYYAAEENDEFELFEDHLLSKESAVLALSEKDVTDLQFDSLIEQLTLNRYQVKRALYPVGTRKYFELGHMNSPIYIGRWNSDYVDVPSQQYRDFALAAFGMNQLEYQCMAQINLEKKAKNIFYEGKSFRGAMVPEVRILDTDGIFYKDLSDQSRRVFLLGEMQGALSVKIDYVDGSSDYLQTFCSAGGWVVEQL